MNDTAAAAEDLDDLLGTAGRRRPWWRRLSLWITVALLALVGVGAWVWTVQRQAAATPRYITEPVTRGALTVFVTANGSLEPTTQVNLGSELSGTVSRVLVDVNDHVDAGQVLVELDSARLRDTVTGARAALAAAQAALQQGQAGEVEARDSLTRLQAVHKLSAGQVPSQSEMAAAEAALARAVANQASARAGIAQARATLSSNTTSLAKASIRSPIDGVVLSRTVEPGMAVAASLQAVTLLTLAEDLTQMKLEVNVDEADVGQVHVGQDATFTVAAYPTRHYPAHLTRVGIGPTTKDNVVTYLTELSVDNSDRSLRPGMTATATITTVQRNDVLLVPNAALRFSPDTAAPLAAGGDIVGRMLPRRPGGSTRSAGTNIALARQVWVLGAADKGERPQPRPIAVTPGVSDGRMTEITSADLPPGAQVIVGQRAGGAS